MKLRDKLENMQVYHKSQAVMRCIEKVRNKVNSVGVFAKKAVFH